MVEPIGKVLSVVFMKGDMKENLISVPDSWRTFNLHVLIASTLPQGPKGAFVGWPETGTYIQRCPADGQFKIIHEMTVYASRRATIRHILDGVTSAVPTSASVEKSGHVIFSRPPDPGRSPKKFIGRLPLFSINDIVLDLVFSSRFEDFQHYLTYGAPLVVSYSKSVNDHEMKHYKATLSKYDLNKDGTRTIHIGIVFSLDNPGSNITWATSSSTVQGVLTELKAFSNTNQVTDLAMKLSPLARSRETTFDILDPVHPVVSGETYYALRCVR
jgi:hypothetical protein